MGCNTSKESPVAEEPPKIVKPVIDVRIGSNVVKPENNPKIIFMFGGPGSKKGTIIDDFLTIYGYHLLSVEDIILHSLPKKLKLTMEVNNTHDLKEIITEDPATVDLHSIMDYLQRKVEVDLNGSYVIDFMPNLKFMLNSTNFIRDPTEELKEFEVKYPVAFAIYLTVKPDQMLSNMAQYCTVKDGSTMATDKGQSDEADSGKTKKRARLFENTSKPFIDYFEKSNRLVTVDVSSGQTDCIWEEVHKFCSDLKVPSVRNVDTFIIFAFSSEDIENVNTDHHRVKQIILRDIIPDPKTPMDKMLETLCQTIDQAPKMTDVFLVMLEGTSISKDSVDKMSNRSLVFMDVEEKVLLEKLVPDISKPGTKPFKAVVTMENETCLFPQDTPSELCRQIGLQVQQIRESL